MRGGEDAGGAGGVSSMRFRSCGRGRWGEIEDVRGR